jgi:hypothetical protein
MLPDRYLQLLTAYVDGELSPRQRRLVQRLLRRSGTARKLLEQLQTDANAVGALPPAALGKDLAPAVLGALAGRRLAPRPVRKQSVQATFPVWLGYAAAAAVLLAFGLVSFVYFSSLQRDAGPNLVQDLPGPRLGPTPVPPQTSGDVPAPLRSSPHVPPPTRPTHPAVAHTPSQPPPDERSPSDRVKEEDLLTDRPEMFKIDRVEVSLPLVLKVASLEQDAGRQVLLLELRKGRDFRLELPCRNGTRALESMQAALKGLDLAAILEPNAQARLKFPQVPTSYALYAEDLLPEEVARLLHAAQQEDRKPPHKPAEHQFDRFVLARMTAADKKELTSLLGLDPTQGSAGSAPGKMDPKQSLEDLTARQVSDALAGQGSVPRPEAGKAPPRPSQRQVLVLAYEPVHADPRSAEIKRFFELRKPPRPGTVRVFLIIRS